MYNTFINYVQDDEVLAKRIYADLLAAGVRPWAVGYDLAPGENREMAEQKAAEACPFLVVLLTKKYFRTEQAVTLTNSALQQGKMIIPVIADMGIKTDLPNPIQLKRRYADAVRDIIAQLPSNAEPLQEIPAWQRGNEAYYLSDYEGAVEAYQEIKDESALALHSRGAAYNALRKHQEALEDLNRAVEMDGGLALFYRNRGLAHTGLGQHELALVDDQKALELEPDSSQNWSGYAMTLLALEKFADSQNAIQKAIDLNPQHAHYHYQKGYILARAGDFDAALASFQQALELDPDNTNAVIGRRMALGRMGRYEEALAEVNKDIKKNPRRGGSYVTRSLMNFYMERYDEAVKDATAALERGREHQLAALYNRAIAYWKLGSEDQAQEDLLKAINMLPQLGTEQGIRNNAESDLTSEPGIAILKALQASGRLESRR